jgi:hypothetical protein
LISFRNQAVRNAKATSRAAGGGLNVLLLLPARQAPIPANALCLLIRLAEAHDLAHSLGQPSMKSLAICMV